LPDTQLMTVDPILTMVDAGTALLRRTRLRYLASLIAFVALAAMFGWGLTHDPRKIPSTLIGKSVPPFSLPPVKGRLLGLSTTDLKGEVSLVNVFASWCVACREEHPLLLKLKANGALDRTILPLIRRLGQQ
jgi:cytochrome c biogenesis protein CcmG/thiol:disulfide interchange protein DsbE